MEVSQDDPEMDAFLQVCQQQRVILLSDIFQGVQNIEKLGEGIFGEVYQGTVRNSPPTSEEEGQGDTSSDFESQSAPDLVKLVFKVVPINGDSIINGEKQKKFGQLVPEIVISRRLSDLVESTKGDNLAPGFVKMYRAYLSTGRYPEKLLEAWRVWNDENRSDNDEPSCLPESQHYMVILFEYGGMDIYQYQMRDGRQALFMIIQVIHTLAVAETSLQFEHRDLHGNNILLKVTDKPTAQYKLKGKVISIPTYGIIPVLIDYTMSRITETDHGKNETICLNMDEDEEMFVGTGDYQFDVYRMMRDLNRNEWTKFHPQTNIFWMHYLINKMIHFKQYKYPDTLEHLVFIRRLRWMKSHILAYKSCTELVSSYICKQLLTPQLELLKRKQDPETNHKQDYKINKGKKKILPKKKPSNRGIISKLFA